MLLFCGLIENEEHIENCPHTKGKHKNLAKAMTCERHALSRPCGLLHVCKHTSLGTPVHVQVVLSTLFLFQNVELKQKPSHNRLQAKRTEDALKNTEEMVKQVKRAFEVCPEITQVAIVLGSTAVSPTEIYVIQFPPLNPEADNLSSKEAVKSLFRQLITHDPLGQVKAIPITNMTVLINAPRNSQCSWFLPKATYKIPNRGNQFHFNLLSSSDNHGSQDISRDFSVIDLSGFEPFESSVIDSPMSEVRSSSNSDSSTSLSADYVCIDSEPDIEIVNDSDCDDITPKNLTVSSVTSDSTCDMSEGKSSSFSQEADQVSYGRSYSLTDQDYIWFQSPVAVKGFREKCTRHTNSSSIL